MPKTVIGKSMHICLKNNAAKVHPN